MSEVLNPCPFAGCIGDIKMDRLTSPDMTKSFRVIHKCTIVKSTMVCTLEQWNTRTPSPAVAAMVEALKRIGGDSDFKYVLSGTPEYIALEALAAFKKEQ